MEPPDWNDAKHLSERAPRAFCRGYIFVRLSMRDIAIPAILLLDNRRVPGPFLRH